MKHSTIYALITLITSTLGVIESFMLISADANKAASLTAACFVILTLVCMNEYDKALKVERTNK